VTRSKDPSASRIGPACSVWVDSVLDPDEDVSGVPREPVVVAMSVSRAGLVDRQLIRIDERLEIGRAGDNSGRRLIVRSDRVSRNHACIIPGESCFEVHDLGSSNGVYVGGSRVASVRLADNGSLVFIGPQVLALRFLSAEAIDAIEEDQRSPLMSTPTLSGRLALLHRKLRALSSSAAPLLISGSVGSGRSSYARAVHQLSGNSGAFVSVDGASLCSEDAEHWLFGSSPCSAGSGPDDGGIIQQAANDTLFIHRLDEVPLRLQDRLAALFRHCHRRQTGQTKVGGPGRLIASTSGPLRCNRHGQVNLAPEMRELFIGRTVRLPSLVHRKEDLGTLTRHLLRRRPHWTISSRAWLSICLYDWPGNLSELTSLLQGLLVDHAASDLFRVTHRYLPHVLGAQLARWPTLRGTDVDATNDPHRTATDGDRPDGHTSVTHARVVNEFALRHRLSDRQAQIIAGAIRGLSSKEIAAELGIDYRTVAEHINRMLEKTGVSDRHQLVARVIDLLIEMLNSEAPGTSGQPSQFE
jgi:DNA-binding NtrC family response regulator